MLILVFVILLFFSPLSLSFSVNEKRIVLSAKVFGLKVFSLDTAEPKKAKAEKKAVSKKKGEKKSVSQMLDTLHLVLELVSRILHHIHLLPRLKKLRFCLEFGLSDAAKTGMAAGAIYALVYGIQARLCRSRRVKIEEVSVTPNFQTPVFAMQCSGIITTCLAHITGIAVVALAVIAKQKMKEE